MTQSNQFKFLK